jgi:hypothetical protein
LANQQQSNPNNITTMSEKIIATTLEVTDEQLEEVSEGVFDNNSCKALLQATVQIGV